MNRSSLEVSRLELAELISENHKLQHEWDALVWTMEHPEVFFTFEWAVSAYRAFFPSVQPVVISVRQEGTLIGVAALAGHADAPKRLFFLSASTGDYCDIISLPANRLRVVEAVLQELRRSGVQQLTLTNLPADSATCSSLRHSQKICYRMLEWPAYLCHRVLLGSDRERSELKLAVGKKQLERRKLKKMTEMGAVKVAHLNTEESISQALPQVVEAQVARFLASNRRSPLLQAGRRRFLQELTASLSPMRWLDLTELRVGEKPIGWNFGFEFGDTRFWYLPTFDPEMEHLSPGSCLLKLMVDEACDHRELALLDLGLGDEPYKGRFANSGRQTLTFSLSDSFWRMRLISGRRSISNWLARAPRLKTFLQKPTVAAIALRRRYQQRGMLSLANSLFRAALREVFWQHEIALFEWGKQASALATEEPGLKLEPLSWRTLAQTAIEYSDDRDAMSYLLRCAGRLRTHLHETCSVLRSAEGKAVHFCWQTEYAGFYVQELRTKVSGPVTQSVILFDSWTPAPHRGHQYYGKAVSLVARNLEKSGKATWMFASAENRSSIRGLQRSGFQYRYSLAARQFLFLKGLRQRVAAI